MLSLGIGYISEFTKFMDAYLKEHPEVAKGQRDARALLWDKTPQNDEEVRSFKAAAVQQKPYPYQTN